MRGKNGYANLIAHLYSNEYNYSLKTVKKTKHFSNWLSEIKDDRPRAIIAQHIVRLENGLGDVKPVGGGVRELRIDVGPGWRVYFIERDRVARRRQQEYADCRHQEGQADGQRTEEVCRRPEKIMATRSNT